jgi:hypothetical protein
MEWNPEKAKQVLLKCWDSFYKDSKVDHMLDEKISDADLKMMFLSSIIVGLTTYDDEIDIIIGNEIYEVMKIIYERKNFKYISNQNNYIKYIKTINYFKEWLDWGTSIRGAWFDYYEGMYIMLKNYDFEEIELSEEFMQWFLYKFLIS